MPRRRRHHDPLVEFFELLLELLSELLSGEGKKQYSRRKRRHSGRKSYYAQCITEEEPLPPEVRESAAPAPEVPPPYAVVPAFMTPAEADFDLVLCRCVDDPLLRVHRKVRMADVLRVVPGSARWQYWFNRISAKHADFVVCLGQRPIAIIELDDSSHNSPKRRARDEFVDKAYAAASLPILHVRAARSYDTQEISAFIEEAAYSHAGSERPR